MYKLTTGRERDALWACTSAISGARATKYVERGILANDSGERVAGGRGIGVLCTFPPESSPRFVVIADDYFDRGLWKSRNERENFKKNIAELEIYKKKQDKRKILKLAFSLGWWRGRLVYLLLVFLKTFFLLGQ